MPDISSQINPCKTCGTQPTVHYYGDNVRMIEIFCPSRGTICYPGRWLSGQDPAQVVKLWNEIHGADKK